MIKYKNRLFDLANNPSLLEEIMVESRFEVVIERRTIQRIRAESRPAALEALAGRLGEVGLS